MNSAALCQICTSQRWISCCFLHSRFPLHCPSLVTLVLLSSGSNGDKVRWWTHLQMTKQGGLFLATLRWDVTTCTGLLFGLWTDILKDIKGWHIHHMTRYMCPEDLKQSVSHIPFLWVKSYSRSHVVNHKGLLWTRKKKKNPSGRND